MDHVQNEQVRNMAKCPIPFSVGAAILSAVGGMLFGYDTGVISGALIQLREQFHLTYMYQEMIVSITLIAAALAALGSGYLTDKFGRKFVIMVASFVFTLGAVVMGTAFNKEMLLVGRVIVGLGVGMASMTVPVYIAEISPHKHRAALVTLNTVCITGGQFLAGIVDGLFAVDHTNGWRYMLGLGGLPSLIQFVGFFNMPETPRWLVEHNRMDEARDVLLRIHGVTATSPEVEAELQIILDASLTKERVHPVNLYPSSHLSSGQHPTDAFSNQEKSTMNSDTDLAHLMYKDVHNHCCNRFTIVRMLRFGPTRRALLVGCLLQLFQQLIGINTVMYYSASIISMAGIGSTLSGDERSTQVVWMAAIVAFANFLFCSLSLWLIQKLRRRTLLLASLIGVFFSLLFLGISFQLITSFSAPVDRTELVPIGWNQTERNIELCSHKMTTCDSCMDTSVCGFCYELNQYKDAVNGSCLPIADTYSSFSLYGRCSSTDQQMTNENLLWAYDYCPTKLGWLTMIGLITYLASFAPGMASLPWTINSELYPTWARSTGVACSTCINWVANVIVSFTFLSLTQAITRQGTYFLYAGVCLLGIIFVYKLVPETGDQTLESIHTYEQNEVAG